VRLVDRLERGHAAGGSANSGSIARTAAHNREHRSFHAALCNSDHAASAITLAEVTMSSITTVLGPACERDPAGRDRSDAFLQLTAPIDVFLIVRAG